MLTSRLSLAAPLFLLAVGCGDGGGAGPDATGGGAANVNTAGTTTTTTGGTSSATGGTGTVSSGGLPPIPLAGSGQAIGGGDQGSLFPPDGSVPIMPPDTGGSSAGGTPSTIPGDGKVVTSMIRGSINGTAVFSQKGEDVTVVVNLMSGCADGKHMFRIHDGDSCDNATTEGVPWGTRGTGWGPADGIQCSGGKGMMMDTRLGADKTKNITVGTHDLSTDVSTHVVIVSDEKDPNSRASCGNFF
jgi:hypothetical protein